MKCVLNQYIKIYYVIGRLSRCWGWTVACTCQYRLWTGSNNPNLQHFQFCCFELSLGVQFSTCTFHIHPLSDLVHGQTIHGELSCGPGYWNTCFVTDDGYEERWTCPEKTACSKWAQNQINYSKWPTRLFLTL